MKSKRVIKRGKKGIFKFGKWNYYIMPSIDNKREYHYRAIVNNKRYMFIEQITKKEYYEKWIKTH